MPWVLIILLLMPFLDIGLAINWLFESPWSALLYLISTAAVGMLLMKIGSIGAHEVMRKLRAEGQVSWLGWMSGFAATWAAGALLLFPGYLSDGLAVLFLIIAVFGKKRDPLPPPSSSSEETLQAEAVIIDEDKDSERHHRDG